MIFSNAGSSISGELSYIYSEWTGPLEATAAQAGENFSQVSISGDGNVLAVGAPNYDGTYTSQGRVQIYDKSGTSWVYRTGITVAISSSPTLLGFSTSLNHDGTLLAVGVAYYDGTFTNEGQVRVYDISGVTVTQRYIIPNPSPEADAAFGDSVSLSSDGNVMAVARSGASTSAGLIDVFNLEPSSYTNRQIGITCSDSGSVKFGGCDLSSDGSFMSAGSYSYDGTYTDQGAAYLLEWSGSAYVQVGSRIVASDEQTGAGFGRNTGINGSGSRMVVGAYSWDNGASTNEGKVYVISINGTTFTEEATLLASDAGSGDSFGIAADIDNAGALIVSGALLWDGTLSDQGAVYTHEAQ